MIVDELEMALPEPSRATDVPTWVPPEEQLPPLAVTVAGLQRKKVTLPVGVGPPPLTVAVSVAAVPVACELTSAAPIACALEASAPVRVQLYSEASP